jgi:hypothetical protein
MLTTATALKDLHVISSFVLVLLRAHHMGVVPRPSYDLARP